MDDPESIERLGEEIECEGCGDLFYAPGGHWINALGQGYYVPDKLYCAPCEKEEEEGEEDEDIQHGKDLY